jgi:O-antigen/teichoic acid export membrane protein
MVFFLNNLLAFLLLKSDYFLVNGLLGVREVGIYSIAVQIADLLLLVPATVATLLFPRLSAIADPAERARMCLQCGRITAGAMGAACALVGGLGPWLIAVVWGAAFATAWVPLLLLLPGVWILTLENVIVMHLAAERLPLAIPALWLSGLLLNVGLNLWWIPSLGPAGAAMTSSIAYAVVSVGVFELFRRRTGAGWTALLVPRAADWRSLAQRLRETLGLRVPAGG